MMKKVSYWLLAVMLGVLAGCSRQKHPAGAKTEPEQAITGSSSDSPVEFKTQWKPDREYQFYFRQVQNIGNPKGNGKEGKHKRNGGSGDQERIFAEDYSLTVTNTPTDRKTQLTYEIGSLEYDFSYSDKFDFTFDSENKAVPVGTDPMSVSLQRLVGGELNLDLKDNKVRKITGTKELLHQALDGLDGGRAGGVAERLLADDVIRHLVEFAYLPTNAVSIGNSWNVTRRLTTGYMTTEGNITCTFKGWQVHDKRKCALFELDGKITSPSEDKASVEDGHLTGRVWFDPELGMTVAEETEQTAMTSFKRNKTGDTITMPVTQSASLFLVDVLEDEITPEPAK